MSLPADDADLQARLARPPIGGHADGDPDGEDEWSDEPVANSRRGARQVALKALYGEATLAGSAARSVDDLASRAGLSEEYAAFARELAADAVAHLDELDDLISRAATGWRLERIARVDGSILRLALTEILHFDAIPVRVSIDEAVELAKLYGGDQSYAFVNGVLDGALRRRGLVP